MEPGVGKAVVLYIRQSSGGGGADAVIYQTASHPGLEHFQIIVANLRKRSVNLSMLTEKLSEKGVICFEIPGRIPIFDIFQFVRVLQLIKKYDIHIVHSHDSKANFYAIFLKIFKPKLRLLSTMHGWTNRSLKSRFYSRVDKFLLRKFAAVIAVSKRNEEIVRKFGVRNAVLIRNAIDLSQWPLHLKERSNNSEKKFYVGFVGRINVEKDPYLFVQVAKKLHTIDHHFMFIVAGQGPCLDAMKQTVKELSLEDHFSFVGQLGHVAMLKLYTSIDLLLMTSRTEGLPMALLEASSVGVPIVATRVGGVPEVIIHQVNGLLAEYGDSEGLADHIITIKRNQTLADDYVKAGREIIEKNFSLEANIQALQALYDRIMKIGC
ncbi:MAG: glycosyltransferase [Chlamydiota bacterium]|nr:glycosyltransferase [Chlamydiota bacterium]